MHKAKFPTTFTNSRLSIPFNRARKSDLHGLTTEAAAMRVLKHFSSSASMRVDSRALDLIASFFYILAEASGGGARTPGPGNCYQAGGEGEVADR